MSNQVGPVIKLRYKSRTLSHSRRADGVRVMLPRVYMSLDVLCCWFARVWLVTTGGAFG